MTEPASDLTSSNNSARSLRFRRRASAVTALCLLGAMGAVIIPAGHGAAPFVMLLVLAAIEACQETISWLFGADALLLPLPLLLAFAMYAVGFWFRRQRRGRVLLLSAHVMAAVALAVIAFAAWSNLRDSVQPEPFKSTNRPTVLAMLALEAAAVSSLACCFTGRSRPTWLIAMLCLSVSVAGLSSLGIYWADEQYRGITALMTIPAFAAAVTVAVGSTVVVAFRLDHRHNFPSQAD